MKRLIKNNKGMSMVTVLVCVAFLTVLGTTVMMLSYTGLEMKVSERRGGENLYNASGVLDVICAGLQECASRSAASAYENALVHYGSELSGVEKQFASDFRNAVLSYSRVIDGREAKLFSGGGESYFYNCEVLADMIALTDENAQVSLENSARTVTIEKNEEGFPVSVTLKGVRVEYALGGRRSAVTSDIVISVPGIGEAFSSYDVSSLPDFAVIAKGAVLQSGGSRLSGIEGSAYAGELTLTGTGTTELSGGTFICAGRVSVSGGGVGGKERLTVLPGCEMWAGDIKVGQSSSVGLLGRSYVADDLELGGYGACARLAGSYTGFGSSSDDSSESSAILANSVNTRLDITELESLTLAGCSFIGSENKVLMGESVSAISNQRAYLIPVEYLRYSDGSAVGTNPDIYALSDAAHKTVVFDKNASLPWGKTFASYGAELTAITSSIFGSDQTVSYYFMRFSNPSDAGEYFRDYFSYDSGKIKDYLEEYISVTDTNAVIRTAGSYVFRNSLGEVDINTYLGSASVGLSNSVRLLRHSFDNLCHTLSPTGSSGSGSPFDYIVDTERLSSVSGTKGFYDDEGRLAAVVAGDGFVISQSTPDSLSLVICSGAVTVERDFDGLVILGGSVDIAPNCSVCADGGGVRGAFSSRADDGESIRSYFNIDLSNDLSDVGGISASDMVRCENWRND